VIISGWGVIIYLEYGKRAIKRVCVYVCVCTSTALTLLNELREGHLVRKNLLHLFQWVLSFGTQTVLKLLEKKTKDKFSQGNSTEGIQSNICSNKVAKQVTVY